MRTALAIFCLFLIVPGISQAQTFGLGGVTEQGQCGRRFLDLGTQPLSHAYKFNRQLSKKLDGSGH
jgi:hypothetical protein